MLSNHLGFLNRIPIDGLKTSWKFFLIIAGVLYVCLRNVRRYISKECFSRHSSSIFARCALRYNPSQFHNASTSERLLSCRRMPTKRGTKVILTFLPLAERQIIYRGSVIVSGEDPGRFLEDLLLITDDKSGDITNKYLRITTRMPLLIFLALGREVNSRRRHCFPLQPHRSILIVNARLIANLAYILLRHITQCNYDRYLRYVK